MALGRIETQKKIKYREKKGGAVLAKHFRETRLLGKLIFMAPHKKREKKKYEEATTRNSGSQFAIGEIETAFFLRVTSDHALNKTNQHLSFIVFLQTVLFYNVASKKKERKFVGSTPACLNLNHNSF